MFYEDKGEKPRARDGREEEPVEEQQQRTYRRSPIGDRQRKLAVPLFDELDVRELPLLLS